MLKFFASLERIRSADAVLLAFLSWAGCAAHPPSASETLSASDDESSPPPSTIRRRASVACEMAIPMQTHPDGGMGQPTPYEEKALATFDAGTRWGLLNKEDIRREIGRHIGEVHSCYEESLRIPPPLEGRVLTRFAIAPSGKVASSCIAESMKDPYTETCIADKILKWRFPKPLRGGWVVVSYPFRFILDKPPK